KFLDPACGCGNFLVITYRELRLLEIEILRNLYKTGQGILDISEIVWLDVDMFFGIELEEFPARIAEVAMWLIDHQMNLLVSAEFGQYFSRLPLKKAANITHGNALQIDWESIVPKNELSYILGNPPFVGSRMMDLEQKKDLLSVFLNRKDIREIDYVTGWYYKASEYIKNTQIVAALVSTNSICQGLHVGIFWNILINEQNIKIHFAHRTFKWSNEARGNAAVYCVIIGFANFDVESKKIYDYEDIKGEPQEIRVKKINPYLVEGENVLILKRTNPICEVPKMKFGNMPADGGNFLFTKEEKENFLKEEPNAEKYFKRFISAFEFINNKERWCLWLVDIDPSELRNLKHIKQRVENVKKIREVSARPHLAKIPHLFAQITQPKSDYLLIPRTTSENRKYIPIGFFSKDNIISDTCQSVPDATIFHFGVLTSIMHMTWVKYVCGRLKSDYRYSKDIVYNNFPWPKQPSEKQVEAIETAAQKVLDARAEYPNSSLADLYDPLTMPPNLV
ncbi:MAG: class I SAM-dependent DNA methyltransferase, partial [Ignavibacteria bacterium]|nr:class I SAM-dependent DNA methyltransferase [Ignavibacteria bacterium]